MNINTQRPLSSAQLAALYSGDARERDSQLFLRSPQAHSWVQGQAANMGIRDPEQFFSAQQAQQQTAAQPSLPTIMANRQSEIYLPGTLPNALQTRDAAWDRSTAAQAAQQAQLAMLQNQQRLTANPLPAIGEEPSFSPLQEMDREAQGLSPHQYLINKRMGPALSNAYSRAGDAGFGLVQKPSAFNRGVTAADLLNDKRFSSLPEDKKAQAFEAILGQSYKTHTDTMAAMAKDRDRNGMDTVQRWLNDGRATWRENEGYQMRQLVPSATDPDRLVVSSEYSKPDAYQSHLLKTYGPQVAPILDEQSRLAARVAQHERTLQGNPQVTSSAPAQSEVDPLKKYASSQAGYSLGNAMMTEQALRPMLDASHLFNPQRQMDARAMGANALKGVANLMGGNWAATPYQNADPNLAQVPQAQHARTNPLFQTARFRQLMQSDPESARLMIARLQGR